MIFNVREFEFTAFLFPPTEYNYVLIMA